MISVIVCTYDRCASLKETLQSIRRLQSPANVGWELILVDNNSTDGTAAMVRAFAATSDVTVRYVFEPIQGLSHARNVGISSAIGEIIAFTDDDVLVDPNWLCELQAAFDCFDCAGVGGKIVPLWNAPKPSWLRLTGPYSLRTGAIVNFDHGDVAHQLVCAAFGANMAFRRETFEIFGRFRTDLGKCGKDQMTGEDTEFCLRLMRAGKKMMYVPSVVVYHRVPKTRLREHFESHYFNYGRCAVRLHGFLPDSVKWLGVPSYSFWTITIETCKWLLSFGPKRFYHKLKVYEMLGAFNEARRLSKLAISSPPGDVNAPRETLTDALDCTTRN